MLTKFAFLAPFAALMIAAAAPAPAPAPSIAAPPEVAANPANRWSLELSNGGTVVIMLRPDLAPLNVARIQELTRRHFYDGLSFHRVIPDFMAQGGDPKGTGEGGSELPDVKGEFTSVPFLRGTVGAARSNSPDSANSQFFIMYFPRSSLDHNYTVMGRVISGMDAVDKIAPGEPPAEPTKIVRAYLAG